MPSSIPPHALACKPGWRIIPLALFAAILLAGCVKVKTKIEPIDINVNVRLKVDRELDAFFQELDARNPTLNEPSEDDPS